MRRRLSTIILASLIVVGLSLLLYPSLADYWNSFHQSRAIASYTADVAKIDRTEYDRLIEKALDYNEELSKSGISWEMTDEETEEYNNTLDYAGNGVMGYINIDKIHVTLSIYHGTSESILQRNIGHIETTSLPVGVPSWDGEAAKRGNGVTDSSEGSHCVLSGHRGLPSAKLFTDLDKLVEGDTFTLNILDETLTYQVDQIRIVEPTDLSDIIIIPGKDLCTLVTCTPYGINTHRLLVRGHRVANAQGDIKVTADALQIEKEFIAPFIAIPVLLLLVLVTLITTGRAGRRGRIVRAVEARYADPDLLRSVKSMRHVRRRR